MSIAKRFTRRRLLFVSTSCIAVTGFIAGCGGQSEEAANTTAAVDETRIEKTVEVPVAASGAPKVVVNAPAGAAKSTTTVSSSTTTASTTDSNAKPRAASAPAKAVPASVAPASKPAIASNAPLVVQGQVVATSAPMKAGEYEGKGYLTYTKYKVLSVEKGSYSKPQIVAAHWGLKDGKPGPAAAYKVGQKVRLELEPFDKYLEKNSEVGTLSAADEVSDMDSEPYWAG